jgi:hypothetical protein
MIHLADQLYVRKFGKEPASDADLIGPCLNRFPEGYVSHGDEAVEAQAR